MNPATPEPRRRLNWRLFVPALMLVLAILACDETYFAPAQVTQIEADKDHPGQAYIQVYEGNQKDMTVSPTQEEAYHAYESDDYGQHWQPSDHVFPKTPAVDYPLTMSGDTLYLNNHPIWSFPRRMFRFFFLDDSSSTPRFALPSGQVSGSLQGNTLYVEMGSQGVLVGHLTNDQFLTDWQITSNGIDLLDPFPMTITDPGQLVGIIAFGLLVPPYALLHAFLLYGLWVYLLPRERARRNAIFTALGLMVVAGIGAAVWLTDIRTDYFQMVAVVTAITVITGVSLTLIFAAGKSDAPQTKWLIIAALLASLVVPAGVAAIFAGWWAVYLLVFGFICFRWAYIRYFSPDLAIWRERWQVDRLALETVTVGGIIAVLVFFASGFLQSFLFVMLSYPYWSFIQLVSVGVPGIAGVIGLHMFVAFRLRRLEKAKRGEEVSPSYPVWVNRKIWIAAAVWLILSVVASLGTLAGQAVAYDWFTTMMR